MNMFARFDENPAMTLQDIKKSDYDYDDDMLRTDALSKGGGGYYNLPNSVF